MKEFYLKVVPCQQQLSQKLEHIPNRERDIIDIRHCELFSSIHHRSYWNDFTHRKTNFYLSTLYFFFFFSQPILHFTAHTKICVAIDFSLYVEYFGIGLDHFPKMTIGTFRVIWSQNEIISLFTHLPITHRFDDGHKRRKKNLDGLDSLSCWSTLFSPFNL